jgi:copper(I)-binding protein
LFFPVVQICDKGRHDWVEKPAAGQDPHVLNSPAPFVTVLAADGAGIAAQASATAIKTGSLVIEAPRSRVTPMGAPVAGGYVTIKNEGSQPDRLVSASVEIADRTEIHEMTQKDGVMTMRALPDGLVIKPGETVELKPGSFHLMFLKPKRPLVEGETLKGQLVFEKSGPVSVEFKVEGMGGNRQPPASGHSGHVH